MTSLDFQHQPVHGRRFDTINPTQYHFQRIQLLVLCPVTYDNIINMADPVVKPDPDTKFDTKSLDGGSPMAVDDDPYEDLDLEFYNTADANGVPAPQDRLLMARVPTYVWAAWDKIEDDTPIEIGRLRTWSEPDKKHPQIKKQQMRLLLKSNVSAHQGLPREYDLFDTNQDVKNTFIFNESDLEAFKNKNKVRREAADQNIPAYLLRPKSEKPPQQQQNSRGRRNRKDTFRQVIPKKTAVYGRVRQEYNMNPIDNPETAYLMAIRAQEQIQPKNTTQIIDRFIVTNNVVQAGTSQATQAFGTFIVSCGCPSHGVTAVVLTIDYRKIRRRRRSRPRPMRRLLVSPRTSCWIASSSALANTTIGA